MTSAEIISVVTIIVQLFFLEGILSIDNAAVLGAMVSVLPDNEPVPYPKPLKFLQKFTDRVMGMQRSAALKVGLLMAYVGRGLMLAVAGWVSNNPILKIVGAAYLIKLALENLSSESDEEGDATHHHKAVNFWYVVLTIEIADLVFSLDNVIAAVALSNQFWVVMVGVALGIVTMRFAATAFTWMIEREPVLVTAAYIVILNIGIELLVSEFLHVEFATWQKFLISLSTILICVAYARLKFLQTLQPALHGVSLVLGKVNGLIGLLFMPFSYVFGLIGNLLSEVIQL